MGYSLWMLGELKGGLVGDLWYLTWGPLDNSSLWKNCQIYGAYGRSCDVGLLVSI